MGKKRKGDKSEKIQRKIRRLQEKLKNKVDQDSSSSEDDTQNSITLEEEVVLEDDDSIYLPPSEWMGSETPLPTSPRVNSIDHMSEPSGVPVGSPQPGPSRLSTSPLPNPDDRSLDENILNLLGDAPKPETNFGNNMHKDVATRWQEILSKGLTKETKEKLISEYLIPANCELLVPPILNPEAKAALPENLVKRDFSLLNKQKQLTAALAALSQVMEMLLDDKTAIDKFKLLKYTSDASRLLCDSHHTETKTRRSFVISSINNNLKGALIDTARDKYLFGENLTEKLRAAKSIQRSGDTLKNQQKQQQFTRNFNNYRDNKFNKNKLNFRALHPRSSGRLDAGQNRQAPKMATGRMLPPLPPPARRPRSPQPPPPPPPPPHRGAYTRR